MKKAITMLLGLTLGFFANSQEHFIGANLNNEFIMYESPIGTAVNVGLMINYEKGLTFNNEWRIGIETGYSQSIGMSYDIVSPIVFPITTPLVTQYTSAVSLIPAHATLSFHSFKPRRKVNMYGKLAVGYVFGQTSTTLLESVQLIGGLPIVIPETTTSASWGGFSGAFRLGTLIEIKQRTTFLDISLGYHAIYGEVYTFSPSEESTLLNGVQFQIGIQYRFIKAR